jgi:hypothetical protein
MPEPTNFFESTLFSAIGNSASIVGLILTVYVSTVVWKIKGFYLSLERIPVLTVDIKYRVKDLALSLGDANKSQVIGTTLAEIAGILENLLPHLPFLLGLRCRLLLLSIDWHRKRYRKDAHWVENSRSVHEEIHRFITRVEYLPAEMKAKGQ